MNKGHKILLFLAVLLIIISLVYFNKNSLKDTEEKSLGTNPSPAAAGSQNKIKYFSPGSDKIVIEASSEKINVSEVVTIYYYAIDGENNRVRFKEEDRAFVRVLGVTDYFNNNTEIFHPSSNGSKNNTIFSGNFTFIKSGVYLIKVCLGTHINLDSEGVMVWPWGCFEDPSSEEIRVY
jgi:hypothetical protein